MRPFDDLYELFSPYEIAAGAVLIQIVFIAAGGLFLFAGRQPAGLLAFLPAIVAGLFADLGVRCPGCGKSLMRYYMTARGEERGGLPMGHRPWPERRCSRCGTPVDLR
ncbi:MAG: hypothetical protein JO013_03460 [Alphaproteobacteria bacterium]|nr:hypothetical protein [Alphaproteobacteria bacterium]